MSQSFEERLAESVANFTFTEDDAKHYKSGVSTADEKRYKEGEKEGAAFICAELAKRPIDVDTVEAIRDVAEHYDVASSHSAREDAEQFWRSWFKSEPEPSEPFVDFIENIGGSFDNNARLRGFIFGAVGAAKAVATVAVE